MLISEAIFHKKVNVNTICNPLVLFFICHLVSSIFKVMLADSSLFNLKAIQVLDCILPLKFF